MNAASASSADPVFFGLCFAGAWYLLKPAHGPEEAFAACMLASCCAVLRGVLRHESATHSPASSFRAECTYALRVLSCIPEAIGSVYAAALRGKTDPSGAWMAWPAAPAVEPAPGARALLASMCPGVTAVLCDPLGQRTLMHTLDGASERLSERLALPLQAEPPAPEQPPEPAVTASASPSTPEGQA